MDVQYYLFSEVVGTKASRETKAGNTSSGSNININTSSSSGGGGNTNTNTGSSSSNSISASSPMGVAGTSGAGSISSSSLGVKRVQKLNIDESLQINVGTLTAGASVVSMTTAPEIAKLTLMTPVCCCIG